MYEIIYMKADFEPWWQLEGWEEQVVERWQYTDDGEAIERWQKLNREMSERFPRHAAKEEGAVAYWTDEEMEYCEACEEDLQTYHGLLFLKSGNIVKNFKF